MELCGAMASFLSCCWLVESLEDARGPPSTQDGPKEMISL